MARITIYMPDGIWDDICRRLKLQSRRVNVSAICRQALEEYLRTHEASARNDTPY